MEVWFGNLIKKLVETPWYTWIVVALLTLLFFALTKSNRKFKWDSRRIAYAAMCVAIAFVLSCIRIIRMPQGGSVTPASMLPIVAFALAYGFPQGALVGCAYGLLQLMQDAYVVHPIQFVVDYLLAFAALSLGAFAAKLPLPKLWKLPMAALIGAVARFLMATLSGAVFFGSSAPEGQPALLYSLGYNLSYLGPDALFCIAVAFIPGVARIDKLLKG